jgi:hypothetical protein
MHMYLYVCMQFVYICVCTCNFCVYIGTRDFGIVLAFAAAPVMIRLPLYSCDYVFGCLRDWTLVYLYALVVRSCVCV